VLSISAALDRIGVAGARAIIFANAVDGSLSRPGGHFNDMVTAVWNHMVATAPLARALAPAFSADPEEAFAIALLHDIGKLVVFDRMSILRSRVRRELQLSPTFVRDVLNQLHEPVGATAMEAWGMGERSARAIGAHHRRTGDTRPNPLAEVVFVAELVDHRSRREQPVELRRVWFDGRITASDTRVAEILSSRAIALT
jgi:putative nucleotidyltransferase with HDIG domain